MTSALTSADLARKLDAYHTNGTLSREDSNNPQVVAGLFETMMINIMLQRDSEDGIGDELFDSPAMRQGREMQNEAIARQIAAQEPLGLRKFIEEAPGARNH